MDDGSVGNLKSVRTQLTGKRSVRVELPILGSIVPPGPLFISVKDIKQAQVAAGHTTAEMTLKHYVKGRSEHRNTAAPIASAYGLEN